jgi:hypothetical protein
MIYRTGKRWCSSSQSAKYPEDDLDKNLPKKYGECDQIGAQFFHVKHVFFTDLELCISIICIPSRSPCFIF